MICKLDYTKLSEIIKDECLAFHCEEDYENACIHFIWEMFDAIGTSIKGETE